VLFCTLRSAISTFFHNLFPFHCNPVPFHYTAAGETEEYHEMFAELSQNNIRTIRFIRLKNQYRQK